MHRSSDTIAPGDSHPGLCGRVEAERESRQPLAGSKTNSETCVTIRIAASPTDSRSACEAPLRPLSEIPGMPQNRQPITASQALGLQRARRATRIVVSVAIQATVPGCRQRRKDQRHQWLAAVSREAQRTRSRSPFQPVPLCRDTRRSLPEPGSGRRSSRRDVRCRPTGGSSYRARRCDRAPRPERPSGSWRQGGWRAIRCRRG
jgi:hypothetical protein